MGTARLATVVAMALALTACAGEHQARGTLPEGWLTRNRDARGVVETPKYAFPVEECHQLQLAHSSLAIDVHDSYFEEEIQDEERRVFQVASYASEAYLVDFDVYEIPKTEAASLYGLTQGLIKGSRDGREESHVTEGIEYYTYYCKIAFDGIVYDTLTLVTEDEGAYLRVVFWLEGDMVEALDYASQMIASLAPFNPEAADAPQKEMGREMEMEVTPEGEAEAEALPQEEAPAETLPEETFTEAVPEETFVEEVPGEAFQEVAPDQWVPEEVTP